VTVLIPAAGEESTIGGCIAAVRDQSYPASDIEVIVVDSMFGDRTSEVAREALAASGFDGTVLSNPGGTRPSNLNKALAAASGSVVCRVDARSRLPKHYVAECVRTLADRPDVAVVGGRQRALPGGAGSVERGIARALNNRWGMGAARYRTGQVAGPADTVYLGAFRTAELVRAGGWDERLPVNEDFELNRRMARYGLVWFDPTLEVGYLPRTALGALASQYVGFGRSKVRYWRATGDRPQLRQAGVAVAAPIAATVGFGLATHKRSRVPVLGAAAGLVAAFEVVGSPGPPGGVMVHAASAMASGIIATCWVAGVWMELASPTTSRGR
jgi:glycosyltransferase involved in cell wall biosynthesis